MTNKEPLEQNLCCHVSLLHKIVQPGETDDKCYILLKYLCYECYRDKLYTGNALDIKRFITIGNIIVRGDRDSRANLMPIYGDLYQIKL